jgi:hypothetical protein
MKKYEQLALLHTPSEPVEVPRPNKIHWVAPYWVARNGIKHQYYRYYYTDSRDMTATQHLHIPGGNLNAPKVQQRVALIESYIQAGRSVEDIKAIIATWQGKPRKAIAPDAP